MSADQEKKKSAPPRYIRDCLEGDLQSTTVSLGLLPTSIVVFIYIFKQLSFLYFLLYILCIFVILIRFFNKLGLIFIIYIYIRTVFHVTFISFFQFE